ncbi:hypothetical protein ABPG73_010429 [Tetrahymena malaccensis]
MEKFNNRQIQEKYQNFKSLGQGAVSAIYYAENKLTNQPVAIKLVTKQKITNDKQENLYYQQELEITKAIIAKGNNENIVNILELIEGTNEYFIVTEYYKDGDLFNLLERFSFKFSPDVAISFCISIANGLSFLHSSKICHRDLKPENILIAKQADDSFLIKISDFGISKISEDMMKSTIGTITYMAPEILRCQPYDEKVDIWSFGCLIYEIFTGEQLFGGNSVKEVALKITGFQEDSLNKIPQSKIPQSIIQIIKKCLKRQPTQRINLDQIIEDLLQAKAEIKVSMTQSVLIQSDKDIKLDIEKEISEQSYEIVGNTTQPSILFTDNLNDSFDNYTGDINDAQPKEKDSNTNNLNSLPLKITKVESQNEQNQQQEFDSAYYTTPKNNCIQNQNQEQNEDKNQQMKLKQLEEEQKNKKMLEKAKNNLIMQQKVEQNQLQQKLTTNLDQASTQCGIEESQVLEKKSNPNYLNYHNYVNLTPQPAKSNLATNNTYPHSDQKLYDLKNNNYQDSKTPNINPFIYNQNNLTTYETKTYNPPSTISQTPQQNIPDIKQQNTNNLTADIIQKQNQSKNSYQKICEPEYPKYENISQINSKESDQVQKNKIQELPSNSTNKYKDQVTDNNKSKDFQDVLERCQSSSQSTKPDKNKKINIKVNYELNDSEKQAIFHKLENYPWDPSNLFKKTNDNQIYQFKEVYFEDLQRTLPCVEIQRYEDICISDFINFIFSSFEIFRKIWFFFGGTPRLKKRIQFLGKDKIYELIMPIGKGAVSSVYKAKDQYSQLYAVKKISDVLFQDGETKCAKQNHYFEKEIKILKHLQNVDKHKHILQIEDIIYEELQNNTVYIVTELCDQGDLYQFQQKFYDQFDLESKLAFSIQIALGVQHLHNLKIAHRDLKPENCFVKTLQYSEANSLHEKFEIKIGDFGLSQINNQINSLKSKIGTPNYMAPEIFKGEDYCEKVDIWSLACIIYEVFTNKQLFYGLRINEIQMAAIKHNDEFEYISKDIQESKKINQLLQQCLKQNPSLRLSIDQIVYQLIEIYEVVKSSKSKSYKHSKTNFQESQHQSLENQYQLIEKQENNKTSHIYTNEEEDFFIIDKYEIQNNQMDNQQFDFLLNKSKIKLSNIEYQNPTNIEFDFKFESKVQKYFTQQELKRKQHQYFQQNTQQAQNKKMTFYDNEQILFANKQYALKYILSKGLQNQNQNQVVFTNKNNHQELSNQEANFAYSFNFLLAQIILFDNNQNINDQYQQIFLNQIQTKNDENNKEFQEFVQEINKGKYTSQEKILKLFEISEKNIVLLQSIDKTLLERRFQYISQNEQNMKQSIEQNKYYPEKDLIQSLKNDQNFIVQNQYFQQQILNILNKQSSSSDNFNSQQKDFIKQLQSFYSIKTPTLDGLSID